ncbi:MAG TPA: malto-oligosyltrehalose trehalohydrolase [Candidatus Binatia bacterium]|nr:malto-oligosyltrehalose trehalohydrolase [Candidatus Binatia bacterium]
MTDRGKDLQVTLGATYLGGGKCRFEVWAPAAERVDVHIVAPKDRLFPLERAPRGYHAAVVDGPEPGSRYFYRLNDKERPDPASRFQPEGVHGPSEVVKRDFDWRDQRWPGLPLENYIIYELHVGTFTHEATFAEIIPRLEYLKQLGVTAVELMPIAQFPGGRNWGYDGVQPFAAQNTYGGPDGLKRLVDACHQNGLAVVLDVVYNHLGPEGNYFRDFGRGYFTERYKTPWGPALNFDGPYSDEVRNYFIQNALYWVGECHIDALRIDAVHAILDHSPQPFLLELGEAVHAEAARLNRRVYLMPESADNDARLLRPRELGGLGLDAQWSDDFHHCVHVLLTGDRFGYYEDYSRLDQMAKAFREGFVYTGEFSPFRKRRHGSASRDIPGKRFIIFSQNHDQVGNRMRGERLIHLAGFESAKLAAGAVLLAPYIPLLFMGEEYGEGAPFPYFISHSDARLVDAVREGRREEFKSSEKPPDPQDEATFQSAKLNLELRTKQPHAALFELYRELMRIRKETPSLASLDKQAMEVVAWEKKRLLFVRRWSGGDESLIVINFDTAPQKFDTSFVSGSWTKVIDSAEAKWQGKGSALERVIDGDRATTVEIAGRAFALFSREAVSGGSER